MTRNKLAALVVLVKTGVATVQSSPSLTACLPALGSQPLHVQLILQGMVTHGSGEMA